MLGKIQQLILLITIILMIGFIIMLVWVFRQANKKNWPPTSQPCPDYWTMNKDGKCAYGGYNGTCSGSSIDFSPLTDCQKKEWATDYSDGKLYGGDNGAVDGHTFCQGGWGNIDYNENKNMRCVYGIDNTNGARVSCNAKDDAPTLNLDGTTTYHKNYSFFCTNSEVTLESCGKVNWDGITYGNDPCN